MSHVVYKIKEFEKKKMPVKLIYISRSEFGKDWHSTPHSHYFTEFIYIVKGRGVFVLPDRDIPVKENDLVIINPFVDHTEKSSQQDSLQYITLGIEGLSFSMPEHEEAKKDIFIYQGNREDNLFYLNKLLKEAQNNESEFEYVCQNIIEILIIKIQREKNFNVEKVDSKRMNKDIAFIRQYIKQNYRNKITLNKLAETRHINKYYLAHSFKKDMGISPIEYLNKIRIKESKLLLETTDFKIADIAEMTGFSSQSFFSQSFKHITKQTPSKYRKDAKKS